MCNRLVALAKDIKYCGRKIKRRPDQRPETRKQLMRKEPYQIFAKSVINDIFTITKMFDQKHLHFCQMTIKREFYWF